MRVQAYQCQAGLCVAALMLWAGLAFAQDTTAGASQNTPLLVAEMGTVVLGHGKPMVAVTPRSDCGGGGGLAGKTECEVTQNIGISACLRRDGTTVSGIYSWDKSGKRGKLEGKIFGGDRLDYKFSNSDCSGLGYFRITAGGSRMAGNYYCLGGTGAWEMTRLKAPRPELASVEIIASDTGDPIDKIAIDQSFRVRLTYAKETCGGIAETVTVRTSRSLSQEVKVTGDTKVIVSKPVSVIPAGSGAGRVEP